MPSVPCKRNSLLHKRKSQMLCRKFGTFMTSETIANETSSSFVLSFSPIGKTWNYGWLYRAFSCYIIAAMLEGKNNTFSLLWEIRSIFMQNCFIVSALQHGCRENPLYILPFVKYFIWSRLEQWWQLFNNIYCILLYLYPEWRSISFSVHSCCTATIMTKCRCRPHYKCLFV